jgi:aminopeptidase-like protein
VNAATSNLANRENPRRPASPGNEERLIEQLLKDLWPLNRSITGNGVRQTLDRLAAMIPTERLTFETGAQVLDWTVPPEWEVTEAYFVDPAGRRHADFLESNLHLLGYSSPFEGVVPLAMLKEHLFTLPHAPTAVPYVTSYYRDRWGFCLSHAEMERLVPGDYTVVIRTRKFPGRLEIGEAVLPGTDKTEVLFAAYVCHPSLANNELSGPIVLAHLYDRLRRCARRRYTYRFLLSVETIGTICYLSRRGEHLIERMAAGFQMTCLGDAGRLSFKKSRRGNTLADRAGLLLLRDRNGGVVYEFDPSDGSDERQFCSPGFNLPVASLMRTKYGEYPEYHTSHDNLEFVTPTALLDSVDAYTDLVTILETNYRPLSRSPRGEPRLGTRNLYPEGDVLKLEEAAKAIMWVVNLSDGEHDLIAMAERSGLPYHAILDAAKRLTRADLISPPE